jgi:hypothetical protein
MPTMGELLQLPTTRATYLRDLLTDAIGYGLRVEAWFKGSPTRSVYAGVSKTFVDFGNAIRDIANQGSRKSARDEALTLHAEQVYGIVRPGASYATTTLRITNAGAASYAWSPNQPLLFVNTAAQKQYTSLGTGVIAPFAANVLVSVRALEPGSASTALAGEIDAFVTSVDGLSIAQPNAAIGEDEMSDADLDAACGARVGYVPTESTIGAGGAAGAYESVARTGPDGRGGVPREDGTRITVTRVRVMANGEGGAEVVVADADGPIEASDLLLVDAAIKAYSTPLGVTTSEAVNSVLESILIAYIAYVPATTSATDEEIEQAALDGITAYYQRVRIGGYELNVGSGDYVFPLDGLRRTIGNAIARVTGSVPAIEMVSPTVDFIVSDPKSVPGVSGTPSATITRIAAEEDEVI